MSLNSFNFIAFIIALFILYFTIPKKFQFYLIIIANLVFFASFGILGIPFIAVTSVISYICAIIVYKIKLKNKADADEIKDRKERMAFLAGRKKKVTFAAAIGAVFILGIWLLIKYGAFFVENIDWLMRTVKHGREIPVPDFLIPIGISYYSFLAVSYIVDVYRGKYEPERNFLKYFCFISYFPHMIQGPFDRFGTLSKTLFEEHSFSFDRFEKGLKRAFWGYIKKIAIADSAALAVNLIFYSDSPYTGIYIILGALFYGVQIYADFSGYMDIMCGISEILGIKIAENFERPYFSTSVEEYWRRWHITLGAWFKDYLFYPIATGKTAQNLGKRFRKMGKMRAAKLVPSYLALVFVWTATGFWHGANWTFIVWGYCNMIVIILSMELEEVYSKIRGFLRIGKDNRIWTVFMMARTFFLVSAFRIIALSDNMNTAFAYYKKIVTGFAVSLSSVSDYIDLFPGMSEMKIFFFLIGTFVLVMSDIMTEIGSRDILLMRNYPVIVRGIVYLIGIYMIILNINIDGTSSGFLYAEY